MNKASELVGKILTDLDICSYNTITQNVERRQQGVRL